MRCGMTIGIETLTVGCSEAMVAISMTIVACRTAFAASGAYGHCCAGHQGGHADGANEMVQFS